MLTFRRVHVLALIVLLPLMDLFPGPGRELVGAREARAGAWTQPRSTVWVKVSGSWQRSEEFYARDGAVLPDGTVVEPGDARPFDENGRSLIHQVWLEAEWGVSDRLTLGGRIPWKRLDYEDRVEIQRSWGWGDLHLSGRYGLLTGDQRLTLRLDWKLPTGRFSTEPGRLPIGDDQSDLEVGLQTGRSLGRMNSWWGVEGGRRLRFASDTLDFDYEDEWFWLAEAGFAFDRRGRLGLKALYQGTRGGETSFGFFAPSTAFGRDFDQLDVALMLDLRAVFVEAGVGWTLGSETYPTAPVWSLGISRRIGGD